MMDGGRRHSSTRHLQARWKERRNKDDTQGRPFQSLHIALFGRTHDDDSPQQEEDALIFVSF